MTNDVRLLLTPEDAGAVVRHRAKCRWSSYAADAHRISNAILTVPTDNKALGPAADECQLAHRRGFEALANLEELAHLNVAVQAGTSLGNEKYKAEIESASARRVDFARGGRPRKAICP